MRQITPLGKPRRAWFKKGHLYDGDEIIGAVVRTKTGARPLYVSIGHQIDLPTATEYVLGCCTKYRLPETTRYAHGVAGGERLPIEASPPNLFKP